MVTSIQGAAGAWAVVTKDPSLGAIRTNPPGGSMPRGVLQKMGPVPQPCAVKVEVAVEDSPRKDARAGELHPLVGGTKR